MSLKDSKQAWVIAVSGCLLLFVTNGNIRTNGVFFVALMEAENLNRAQASWPFNLPGVTALVASPLTGIMVVKYSPLCIALLANVLFILGQIPCYFTTNIYVMSVFYGLVRGFAVAMISTLIPIVISVTFDKRKSTAMGLSMAGAPLGGLVLPVVAQYLLLEYGLKGSILVLAGISLHAFVFVIPYRWYDKKNYSSPSGQKSEDVESKGEDNERTPLLRSSKTRSAECVVPNKDSEGDLASYTEVQLRSDEEENKDSVVVLEKTEQPQTKSNAFDMKILKNIFCSRGFYLLSITQMFGSCSNHMFTQVIIDYLMDKGISELLAVYMVTANSAGDICGKLLLGLIPDRGLLSTTNHTVLCLTISAGMTFLLTFTNNFPALLAIAFSIGAFLGSVLSVNFVQVSDYVGKEEIPLTMAFMKILTGLGFFTIPSIIGYFRDQRGSYDLLFYAVVVAQLAIVLLWITESVLALWRRRRGATRAH